MLDSLNSVFDTLLEPWALLILGASFIYASLNYLDEWLLKIFGEQADPEDDHSGVGTLTIVSGLFGIVTALGLGVYSFYSNSETSSVFIEHRLIVQAMFIGALEMLWLIPYLYATSRSGALEAAPLFQSIPVISLLLGILFFAEIPPSVHVLGSIAIVIGGAALNTVPGTLKLDWKTIRLMLFSSLVISLIYFIFKDTALESNFVATAFWGGIGMTITTAGILFFHYPYKKEFVNFCKSTDRRGLGYQFVNESLNTVSVLMSQRAIMLGPSVMAVTALSAYQPLFILLIGWMLAAFGSKAHVEQLAKGGAIRKTVAILLIALGTVLISQEIGL